VRRFIIAIQFDKVKFQTETLIILAEPIYMVLKK